VTDRRWRQGHAAATASRIQADYSHILGRGGGSVHSMVRRLV
jgi:hypothetical protein